VRIIAGKYKGTKLERPKDVTIRPTTDRIKETIFNILQSRRAISGAKVLDLFCGSGALGCEAASRGAKKIYFVDNSKKSIELLKQNLSKLKLDCQYYCTNFDTALKSFYNNNIQFDLILLDPPYNKELEYKAVDIIINYQLLNKNGYIVIETDKENKLQDFVSQLLLQHKLYKCGNTMLHLISQI